MTENKTPTGNRFDTGAELRRIRGDRNQQEFADLLGVGRNTIQRYETNERTPDAEFLFKLNLLFGVDPGWLILGKESGSNMNQRESKLLTNYRRAGEDGKVMVEQVADFAARAEAAKAEKTT